MKLTRLGDILDRTGEKKREIKDNSYVFDLRN